MMKKYILLLITSLAIISSACEEWLEVYPNSEIPADKLFESEDGFKDALTGVYLNLTKPNLYGRNLSWHTMDNLAQLYDLGGSSKYSPTLIYNYEENVTADIIYDIWIGQYNTISNINKLLENLDENGDVLDPTLFNIIKGEALALRAYCHFDLIRMFGDGNLENRSEKLSENTIPYVTKHSKNVTAQKSYSETFKLIEKDILEALELLKSDPLYHGEVVRPDNYDQIKEDPFISGNNLKGRETKLNYVAVKALQSRIYLWEGDIAKALIASEETIQLIDENIALDVNAWATESWGVGYGNENYRDQVFYFEQLFCLDVYQLFDYMEDFYVTHVNGSPNPDRLMIEKSFIDDIFKIESEEGLSDLRFQHQLEYEAANDGYLTIKVEKTEGIYFINTIPMLKISEPYLIAAECYTRASSMNLAKSIEYLNLLKEKRNIVDTYFIPTDATLEEVNLAIQDEYRKEFIMEGQLFFFYKRLGKSVFPGLGNIEMTDQEYTFPYPVVETDLGQRN